MGYAPFKGSWRGRIGNHLKYEYSNLQRRWVLTPGEKKRIEARKQAQQQAKQGEKK